MIKETYPVWKAGEYQYPGAFGFVPDIHAYIHDDSDLRPGIVIIPGGGYRMVSPTEGEIVAQRFFDAGFQTFVLTYTTNLIDHTPLKDQPLRDLSRTVRYLRANAAQLRLQAEQLFLCGFSAGAHLAGSLAVHWMDISDSDPLYQANSNRPSGVILSYPVITSGTYAHRDSFTALLGADATDEELAYASLELQVTSKTPPVFLWQTLTDEIVPVENSLLMANALKAAGVSIEYHLIPRGAHGLSLSNALWETGDLGDLYPMAQNFKLLALAKSESSPLSTKQKEQVFDRFSQMNPANYESTMPRPASGSAVKEVAVWPELAAAWMKGQIESV